MKKIRMQTFIEQAEAMIDAEVKRFRMNPGELPDIDIGKIAGQGVDFLRRHGVPVTGYTLDVCIILTLDRGEIEPITKMIPLKESILLKGNRLLLKQSVEDFLAQYGSLTSQNVRHGVKFVVDESQIED
jgi:hypothetical protein